jgi:type IV pilus assembly protein PilE
MRNPSFQFVRGFTLVELMITVLVVGILATIALPSYQEYVIRSHRAAAQSEMMNIANRQQQFLIADRGYAELAALEASGYVLPPEISSRYGYAIAVDNEAAPPVFTITFTAKGPQLADGNLTLDSTGVKTPIEKW